MDPRAHPEAPAAAPPADDPDEETASLVGTPYRPLGVLGRGGMGVVFEAEHVALGKRVVIKLLHPDLAARPDLVDRVRLEAQTLAHLSHPNLVAVHDFAFTPEGRPYIAMERLRGRTLRDELALRERLPWPEAVAITCDALAGLAAAHDAGIVHRDVKLDNLFLCEPDASGRRLLKVLDFGIAKVVGAALPGSPAPLAYPTEEGALIGTPRFLSPEQAMGRPVDARTDLYAVGVVLYTLVVGRGPFHHLTRAFDLVQAHARERPPPPSTLLSEALPKGLEALILRALAKRPDDRYVNARAFADELARIVKGSEAAPGLDVLAKTEPLPPEPRPPPSSVMGPPPSSRAPVSFATEPRPPPPSSVMGPPPSARAPASLAPTPRPPPPTGMGPPPSARAPVSLPQEPRPSPPWGAAPLVEQRDSPLPQPERPAVSAWAWFALVVLGCTLLFSALAETILWKK